MTSAAISATAFVFWAMLEVPLAPSFVAAVISFIALTIFCMDAASSSEVAEKSVTRLSTVSASFLYSSTSVLMNESRLFALEERFSTDRVTVFVISCISLTVFLESSASLRISSATTANPLPASPALAASIAALRASRLVWDVICSIASASSLILSTVLESSNAFSSFSLTSTNTFKALSWDSIKLFLRLFALMLISPAETAPS